MKSYTQAGKSKIDIWQFLHVDTEMGATQILICLLYFNNQKMIFLLKPYLARDQIKKRLSLPNKLVLEVKKRNLPQRLTRREKLLVEQMNQKNLSKASKSSLK